MTQKHIMHSDFTLAGQWFVCHGLGHRANGELHLRDLIRGQVRGIRRRSTVSGRLSRPSRRRGICGWLADSAGVSWQIVPADMGELMEMPNAYQKLMTMKKIDAEF